MISMINLTTNIKLFADDTALFLCTSYEYTHN